MNIEDYVPQKNIAKATSENDADAQYILALGYRQMICDLEVYRDNEDQKMDLGILAHEFHRWLKTAASNGSEKATAHIETMCKDGRIPLREYDGKVFDAFAELAHMGDESAKNSMRLIQESLERTLRTSLMDVVLPKALHRDFRKAIKNYESSANLDAVRTSLTQITENIHPTEQNTIDYSRNNLRTAFLTTQRENIETIVTAIKVYDHMTQELEKLEQHP